MAYSAQSEVTLATDEELQKIADLRTKLEPELKKLAEEKHDFPHTTGDLFFTRLLRGNNGNIDEAVAWYQKFVELRSKFGLDDIHNDCEGKNIAWVMTAFPHYEELKAYMNVQCDEKVRTPSGHLVWYDAAGDSNTKKMLTDLGQDKYIKFNHYLFERRTSTLDKLSRAEGKMVKIVRVMDFEATGMWMLNKEIKRVDQEFVTPVLMGTSIETVHVVFMINFPWFGKAVFDTIKPLLPPRLVARFRILDTDYLQNKEYISEVGPALDKQLIATKTNRNKDTDPNAGALEGAFEIIGAGRVMERIVEVKAGQKVTWQYRIAKPDETASKRSLLGKLATAATSAFAGTEIVFSVNALWTDTNEADMAKIPAKVRSAGLDSGDAAEFWVDGKAIDFTVGPGVNVVAVNPLTKEVLSSVNYDAVSSPDAASEKLISDLKAIPRASMVLVAVKGTGAEKLTDDAIAELKTVGSTITSGHWHEGYALVGRKGGIAVSETRGPDVIAEGNVPVMETDSELVEPKEVAADAGEVKGSITADRSGIVIVRWSNFHSFFARKMVSDFKVALE